MGGAGADGPAFFWAGRGIGLRTGEELFGRELDQEEETDTLDEGFDDLVRLLAVVVAQHYLGCDQRTRSWSLEECNYTKIAPISSTDPAEPLFLDSALAPFGLPAMQCEEATYCGRGKV